MCGAVVGCCAALHIYTTVNGVTYTQDGIRSFFNKFVLIECLTINDSVPTPDQAYQGAIPLDASRVRPMPDTYSSYSLSTRLYDLDFTSHYDLNRTRFRSYMSLQDGNGNTLVLGHISAFRFILHQSMPVQTPPRPSHSVSLVSDFGRRRSRNRGGSTALHSSA